MNDEIMSGGKCPNGGVHVGVAIPDGSRFVTVCICKGCSGVFVPTGAKVKQAQRCTLCGSTVHKSNRCTVYPDHED